jgi:hypothetical protein
MSRRCGVCSLPAELHRQVNDRANRRLVPLRAISAFLDGAGHTLSHSAIHRHLNACLLPEQAKVREVPVESRVGLVALAVRDTIGWSSHRRRIVARLEADGLHDEAKIIDAEFLGELPPTLADPQCTAAGKIIEARYVVGALGSVLRERFPETSLAIADQLDELRASDDLREAFRWLAEQATEYRDHHPTSTANEPVLPTASNPAEET